MVFKRWDLACLMLDGKYKMIWTCCSSHQLRTFKANDKMVNDYMYSSCAASLLDYDDVEMYSDFVTICFIRMHIYSWTLPMT